MDFLLKHHVYKRSHDTAQVAKPLWMSFGYPLMWNTDALEMLNLLAGLDVRDPRMDDALALVLSKQDARGRWQQESPFSGRFQATVEPSGKPSKWVTLCAATAIKRLTTCNEAR